eukprot:5493597-Lingulodinium_polyedra.AAC.1
MIRSSRPSAAATARKSHASRAPCEHHFSVFTWTARGVRFARRRGRGRTIPPHHCARFLKPRAMALSSR